MVTVIRRNPTRVWGFCIYARMLDHQWKFIGLDLTATAKEGYPMKRCASMLLAISTTWLLVSCGASSSGSVSVSIEQGMIDAIKGYTQVMYQNDQDNFDKYCARRIPTS